MGDPVRELREALSGLSRDRITTGVLADQAVYTSDRHRFAGQGDTVVSYRGFRQQYWEFLHAVLDSSRYPSPGALSARVRNQLKNGATPLLVLRYTYDELLPTAASQHLITIDSVRERVSDGPDLSRSPYRTGQFFSATLPTPAEQTTVDVYVGPEFWLGNVPVPATVRLDLGDGREPLVVAMNWWWARAPLTGARSRWRPTACWRWRRAGS